MKKIYFAFITLILVGLAMAEGTRQWKETGYDEFGTRRDSGCGHPQHRPTGTGAAFKVLSHYAIHFHMAHRGRS